MNRERLKKTKCIECNGHGYMEDTGLEICYRCGKNGMTEILRDLCVICNYTGTLVYCRKQFCNSCIGTGYNYI